VTQQNTKLIYRRDSSALMQELSHMDMPVFLDSSLGSDDGAKDFFTAAPAACLLGSESASGEAIPGEELVSRIRALQSEFLAKNYAGEASVAGGVFGFLGYPRLRRNAANKQHLDYSDYFVGIYLWNIAVDHQHQTSELAFHNDCPLEFREQLLARLKPFLRSSQDSATANNLNATSDRAQSEEFDLIQPFAPLMSREKYGSAFKQIKHYIQAGDCYQVNLTQRFTASCQGSPFTAYDNLRSATKTPFSAFMQWQGGALLSLSPERFLSLCGNKVQTRPIKGTRPRSSDLLEDHRQAEELVSSEKDRAENLMIVDLLRNDLGRVCSTGTVSTKQLFTLESFSNVHHLVSTVEGELAADKDALDLLFSCFPGGSITGAPKIRAMEIIEELEISSRRAYCGSVFRIDSNGDMDSSIIIRSLLWEAGKQGQDRLDCWAGGGIVADSLEDSEYQECFDKINSIFRALKS